MLHSTKRDKIDDAPLNRCVCVVFYRHSEAI